MDANFVKRRPAILYHKCRTYKKAVERSNKGRSVKSVLLMMQELVPTYIQRCVSDTIFDGMDLDEAHLKEGTARHAKFYADTEIDPSEAVVGLKKALAVRSEAAAMGRVEAHSGAHWKSTSQQMPVQSAFSVNPTARSRPVQRT